MAGRGPKPILSRKIRQLPTRVGSHYRVRPHLCAHGQEYRRSEYHPSTGWLLRAAPRPLRPLPVGPWARACGLLPAPGGGPHTVSLIGPGPDFDPEYAMTTDLTEPVIIATVPVSGGPPCLLLIDGYAQPVTVH